MLMYFRLHMRKRDMSQSSIFFVSGPFTTDTGS